MGADIHPFIERKINKKWVLLHPIMYEKYSENDFKNRNYERFAALANVRGPGPSPKGIPDNASEGFKYYSEEYGQGHSHSWHTLKEALDICMKTSHWGDPTYDKPEDIKSLVLRKEKFLKDIPMAVNHFFGIDIEREFENQGEKALDPYRVIYFFDN